MNARFLQLSGVVIDLVHHIDHLPRSGEEVETPDMMVTAGGGFNAMQAARRMGIDVSYGGSLGTGMFADITAKALADAGIGTLPLARQAIDQGTCAVLVDSSGERSFISHHGAERKIDAAGLDAIDVSEGDWILLTGYSLFKPETAAAFLPWLQRLRKDANFIFDPGPVVAEIPTPALNVAVQRADWISANLSEAGILTGLSDPAAAALELSRRRKGAIVRTGADGCWLACAGHVQHIAGFEVEAVDTNGAGDTHDGVFIAANCLGYNVPDAACLGNAAAALSTTRRGPATAPDLAGTLAFIKSRGLTLAEPDGQRLRKTIGSNRAPQAAHNREK